MSLLKEAEALVGEGKNGRLYVSLRPFPPTTVPSPTYLPTLSQNWERAMTLLKEAEALVGEGKDGRLYTATMRICGAAGKRERVLELFQKMRRVIGLQQSNTRGR